MNDASIPCPRCRGLSVATRFGTGYWWAFDGWLCLNCGDVIDPVILTNRRNRANGSALSLAGKGMRSPGGAVATARYQRLS